MDVGRDDPGAPCVGADIIRPPQKPPPFMGEVARYKDALTPAIILIPGKEGSLGIGMANVKTAVERAVGADIL